jgi:hypothetical protein
MIDHKYKYSELTSKIIGSSMEVHKILGNGFQEVIYQRALAKEMSIQGLSFAREFEMPIFYKEDQIGTRRVDFLVAINYLEANNLEIGLLINFGAKSLEFKRLINAKYKSAKS